MKVKINEIEMLFKHTNKAEKIIKSEKHINDWYELGNIKLFFESTIMLPIVEVWRINPDVPLDKQSSMEKKEKDKITNFLKKNGFLYYSKLDCYVLTN